MVYVQVSQHTGEMVAGTQAQLDTGIIVHFRSEFHTSDLSKAFMYFHVIWHNYSNLGQMGQLV